MLPVQWVGVSDMVSSGSRGYAPHEPEGAGTAAHPGVGQRDVAS